jgi:hypothetical protein
LSTKTVSTRDVRVAPVHGTRLLIVVALLAMVLAGCGGQTAPSIPGSRQQATATTTPLPYSTNEITLLDHSASPPLGVLEATTPSSVHLFVTHDFVHYVDITPPGLPSENRAIGGFDSASFPTPDDGWVTEANADHSEGFLFHTSDGGRSWQLVRQVWGGSAGMASVSFIDPDHGWLVAGDMGDDTLRFSSTTDGGLTWQPLLNEGTLMTELGFTMPAFADSEQGIGVSTSVGFAPSATVPAPKVLESSVEATSNGGSSWAPITVPVSTPGVRLYDQPAFFGQAGLLPVLVKRGVVNRSGSVTVDFDTTSDGGMSWTAKSTLRTVAVAKIGGPGGAVGILGLPGAPTVGVATAADWWVLGVAPSGEISVSTTSDGGDQWMTPQTTGLPVVPLKADAFGGASVVTSIEAVNSKIAFASVTTNPAAPPATYFTSDGGAKWTPLAKLG